MYIFKKYIYVYFNLFPLKASYSNMHQQNIFYVAPTQPFIYNLLVKQVSLLISPEGFNIIIFFNHSMQVFCHIVLSAATSAPQKSPTFDPGASHHPDASRVAGESKHSPA